MSGWRTWILGALLVAAFFVWYAVFAETREGLEVYFFDVGQGDSIFIEADNGRQVLIDGGPTENVLSDLGAALPFYDRYIDVIILTHPHRDHLDGLVEVLKRYRVGMVIEAGVEHPEASYQEWHQLLEQRNIPIKQAYAGQKLHIDIGAVITILAPFENYNDAQLKNVHASTVVSRLDYGEHSILLTGDMEALLERKLVFLSPQLLDADILKVGHHGSKTSTSEEFLQAVSPQTAIISSGKDNRYGHPNPDVLNRLQSLGIKIHRTDLEGTILLIFLQGKQISLKHTN